MHMASSHGHGHGHVVAWLDGLMMGCTMPRHRCITLLPIIEGSLHNIIHMSVERVVGLGMSQILFGIYTMVILLSTLLYEIHPDKLG